MSGSMLIKNGTLICSETKTNKKVDLVIKDGLIFAHSEPDTETRASLEGGGIEIIDAQGCYVMPGFIDMHCHLREPGYEWKETIETGTMAAAAGGFTAVCPMANTNPVNDCSGITRFIRQKAEEAGYASVYPIGAVSRNLKGKELAPLSELFRSGCIAFSDDGKTVKSDLLMRRALEWSLIHNLPICCHEESVDLAGEGVMNESPLSSKMGLRGIPGAAEDLMVLRDVELARLTGGRIHICHVSTRRSVEIIRQAKSDGVNVTAEATPHHLLLNEDKTIGYNTMAKVNPPLRSEADRKALIAGLIDGTIDAIATDHAPHERDSKLTDFASASFGTCGFQTALPLVLRLVEDEGLSLNRMVEALSLRPARIFNLPGGSLAPGVVADVTIIDPDYEWTFDREQNKSKSHNSLWLGEKLKGHARCVISRGECSVKNGNIVRKGVH